MPDLADYYREIYVRGLGGETPAIPVAVAELERRGDRGDGAAGRQLRLRRGRQRGHDPRQPEAFRRTGSCRGCCATSPSATSRHRARHGDAGAADAGPDRGPEGRPRGGRAGDRPRRGRGRRADDRQHRLPLHARGDRRGRRRGAALVPALLGRTTRELLESFVERAEAAGYGAIVVTVDTFIPGWKPRDLQQAWLPFLEGMGVANYFQDPVFRAALEKPPEEDLGRRHRPLPRRPGQPLADLGRPGDAARDDLAADRRQGDPARRRRPRGGAARGRRDRRLQPRRPPGRRRDRLARRPAADRRGGRRRARGPLRQRRPRRRRRAQGARPRRRRRLPRPPLHLGPGARRPGGRRSGAARWSSPSST